MLASMHIYSPLEAFNWRRPSCSQIMTLDVWWESCTKFFSIKSSALRSVYLKTGSNGHYIDSFFWNLSYSNFTNGWKCIFGAICALIRPLVVLPAIVFNISRKITSTPHLAPLGQQIDNCYVLFNHFRQLSYLIWWIKAETYRTHDIDSVVSHHAQLLSHLCREFIKIDHTE